MVCFGLVRTDQWLGLLMHGYDSRLVFQWRFASMLLDLALIIGVWSVLQ
jgi:hypothetical protein